MGNFDDFKSAKIKNLNKMYNKNYTILSKNATTLIKSINSTNARNKMTLINNVMSKYFVDVQKLKNKLNNDISTINKLIQPIDVDVTKIKNTSALLIGINYIGTENELSGCINDVIDINNLLTEYNFDTITMLTDNTIQKPTRNNILESFTSLLKNAKSGDTLLFYYSGHGSYKKDLNAEEVTGYDQMIIPIDLQSIVDDDLKNIIQNNLPNGATLIAFFDSCFSGSVLDLPYTYMDSLDNNNVTENANQVETTGNVIMISGCSDVQTSADALINNKNNGAMSWAFLEAFKKNNKDISWRNLLVQMRELLRKSTFSQIPQLSSGSYLNIDSSVFI